ncbi:DUF885 family protein [Dokdonella sp.]|uniref:DUF885 domain-containing protein n=1 Tax=Dokdonella sp. TaxID=2291710 RepID=UPI003528ED24
MIRIAACACAALLCLATRVHAETNAQTQAAAGKELRALFDAEWERGLVESPESASYNGDPRFNDRWSDFSLEAIARSEAGNRAALVKLHAIDRSALSKADKLNYDTFEWLLEKSIERQKFLEFLQPVGHQGGVQNADGIVEILPFATIRDYQDWLKRMQALPRVIQQVTVLMQKGVKQNVMPPKVLMQRVPAQIASQVVEDPTLSPFYRPFLHFPDSIPASEQSRLQAEARAIITDQIVPAYRKFGVFFDKEYLPHARESIAAADQANGKAYYDFLAAYYTTTDLTAAEIHTIGLAEVARIRAEMEKVKTQTGFKGSLPEFFTYLRTDPKFYLTSPEALLERYRAVSKRIDPELVKVFHVIPRMPYGVRPIPANIAPDTTTAYYQPGATDGSRAGFYYVNLYKPEVRPTWEMMPLSLHEAVPGHHFQFARGLELEGAPDFRRTAYFVAYGEGWGLYAEQLGFDMGLYDDPYDHFGQLTYEMWRAVRLVIDTGMHSMGWSRDKAIAYFKDNAAKTEQDIVNEVDRYIGTPGQALAYKIGQLKISQLRSEAEQKMGAKFDLRAFNDAVLATGSVPLNVLENHMSEWMSAEKAD